MPQEVFRKSASAAGPSERWQDAALALELAKLHRIIDFIHSLAQGRKTIRATRPKEIVVREALFRDL